MELPFENFDPEDTSNKNRKLSIIEKIIIKIGRGIVFLLLSKIKKAETYGDIYKIINKTVKLLDNFEEEKLELEEKNNLKNKETTNYEYFSLFKKQISKLQNYVTNKL